MRTRMTLAAALTMAGCPGSTVVLPDAAIPDAGVEPACPGLCVVSLVAGSPGGGGSVDGVAERARTTFVTGLTGAGESLYFVSPLSGAVRRMNLATKEVTTIAGKLGQRGGVARDGRGEAAAFELPITLAELDGSLYVADSGKLRRIDLSTGDVSTVIDPATGEAWAPATTLIRGLAAADGTLYVAGRLAIWSYDPRQGTIALLAGDPERWGLEDGSGPGPRFFDLWGLTSDGRDTLYATDYCRIRAIDRASGAVLTFAGETLPLAGGEFACPRGAVDGQGPAARFYSPRAITFSGDLLFLAEHSWDTDPWIAEFGRVRQIEAGTARVTTLAGRLPSPAVMLGEQDGSGGEALLLRPWGIWAGPDDVYVGTQSSIRAVNRASGRVSTIVGHLSEGTLLEPSGLVSDGDQLFTYITRRHQLARVTIASGEVDVVKTFDEESFPVGECFGLARLGREIFCATLFELAAYNLETHAHRVLVTFSESEFALDLAVDGERVLVLLDSRTSTAGRFSVVEVDPAAAPENRRVRFVSNELSPGSRISQAGGAIYVADRTYVARLDSATSQTILAGNESAGCEDGASARFGRIISVAAAEGRLFLGDAGCHAIRMLDLASGVVTTLVGSPERPVFAEGMGPSAGLNEPSALFYDISRDTLYFADRQENIVGAVHRAR
jgi:hypothetical protein